MNILNFIAAQPGNTGPGFGFKAGIILFDTKPGTRSITLTAGTYRRVAVGGGGGHHATPGSAAGGTSSWSGGPTATGGAARAAGGVGSGGTVNFDGGSTAGLGLSLGGGASGTRMGSPPDSVSGQGGNGWTEPSLQTRGGIGVIDGFGLGVPPGTALAQSGDVSVGVFPVGVMGQGASTNITSSLLMVAGMGAGGGGTVGLSDLLKRGGSCGGGAGGDSTYSGSGGGYSEDILVVTGAGGSYSYTVGAGGSPLGGAGLIMVEKL